MINGNGQSPYFTSWFVKKVVTATDLTASYTARVTADGGVVIDPTAVLNAYTELLAQGLYTNLVEWHSAAFGVKKDGSNNCSKLYDLSSNNNDKVQGTLANQPLWSANILTFNGTTHNLQTPYNSSYSFLVNFTAMGRIIPNPTATTRRVYSHMNNSANRRKWSHGISTTDKFTVNISLDGTAANLKAYSSVASLTAVNMTFCTTFSNNDLKVYTDNVELTVGDGTLTKTIDVSIDSMFVNTTDPVIIGSTADNVQYFNNVYISTLLFNTILNSTQRTAINALL
jgi:hypothetical protein